MAQRIVWISGASAGIGRSLAETCPDPDARVIDISRSGGAPGTEHLPADLSDPDAWTAVGGHFSAQLTDQVPGAVFFANAGTLDPVGFAAEVDLLAYRSNVLLNAAAPQVLGAAFLSAAVAAQVPAQLVLLTSGAARKPYPGWSAYCAAKAAVDMWTQTVGRELELRKGEQRVFAVAPGVVATGMQERIRGTDEQDFPAVGRFTDLHAEGQLADPADAASGIWALVEGGQDNGAVVDLRGRR